MGGFAADGLADISCLHLKPILAALTWKLSVDITVSALGSEAC